MPVPGDGGAIFTKEAYAMISANIDPQIRKAVYKRDGYQCALCSSTRYLQIHHAIPRGRGGDRTSPHNMITLCQVCHMQAHGDNLKGMPFTQADVEQACVEYLADMYAPAWWPWRQGYDPGQGG